jgi:hypothetical protein
MRSASQILGMGAVLCLIAAPNANATTTSIATAGNVLAGSTVFASTEIGANFLAPNAVDNLVRATPPSDQDHGLIFQNNDPSERLGLTGSFGPLQSIRIWTIPSVADQRIPNQVTVLTSANIYAGGNLIVAGNYETNLGTFTLGIGAFTGIAANTDNTFATIAVNAPANTQSLYLDFGSFLDGKGDRISEVQAFIPEPSSALILLGASAFAMRRRAR